jgi:HAE1 family hydrophobic/amphiphilic exporter-1
VQEGKFDVLLRTQGEYQNLDDIRNLVVATRNRVPVYLRDVASSRTRMRRSGSW